MRSYFSGLPTISIVLAAGLGQSLVAQPRYILHDLGLGFTTGINAGGQVTGSFQGANGQPHGFRTAPNSPINLATDDLGGLTCTAPSQVSTNPCPFSRAYAINDFGNVAGQSAIQFSFLDQNLVPIIAHAFRTSSNSKINPATDDLAGGAFSMALGINNSGQLVGLFTSASGNGHAFRMAPNHTAINPATDDLGTLGGFTSSARGINSIGQAVGFSQLLSLGFNHGFRTAPNGLINPVTDDLGSLGGSNSDAMGINDSGQVVGNSGLCEPAPPCSTHAFRTAPNSAINPATDDLGTLGGLTSSAAAINNAGVAVGVSDTITGDVHAFVHIGGKLYDLNDLIQQNSGTMLFSATGINDRGQIAGYGSVGNDLHAFRLDPATPADVVSELFNEVGSLGLPRGILTVLDAKLDAARDLLARGNNRAARDQIVAFEDIVTALRRRKLTDAQADTLLSLAALAF